MGTRSLTIFEDERGEELAVLYRQMDGYPSGHGRDLQKVLGQANLVNGYGANDPPDAFNGMSDLAVRVIHGLKQLDGGGIGNLYLYPAGTRDAGEEWVYHLRPRGNHALLTITTGGFPITRQVYSGRPSNLDPERAEAKSEAE